MNDLSNKLGALSLCPPSRFLELLDVFAGRDIRHLADVDPGADLPVEDIAPLALALAFSGERPVAQSFFGALNQCGALYRALTQCAARAGHNGDWERGADGIARVVTVAGHTFYLACRDHAQVPDGPRWKLNG